MNIRDKDKSLNGFTIKRSLTAVVLVAFFMTSTIPTLILGDFSSNLAYAQNSNADPNPNPNARCPPQQSSQVQIPPFCGKLFVIKNVEGGSDPPESFMISVTGTNPSPNSFRGSSSGTTVIINEGSYTVREVSGPGGYTASYSPGCSGTMTGRQISVCTITNMPEPTIPAEPATLIVKVFAQCLQGEECPNLPVYTGAPDSVFIFLTDAINPIPPSFWGSEAGTSVSLGPGGYNVAGTIYPVTGLEYLDTTISPECSDRTSSPIESGEVRTCTWTNIFRPWPSE